MNSPVIDYLKLISIDPNSPSPIYVQGAQQLVNAIQRRIIPSGTKLIGTRSLASLLKLHRQTVVAMYEELELQGWVKTLPNKGTFVVQLSELTSKKGLINENTHKRIIEKTGFTFRVSALMDSPYKTINTLYAIDDGEIDVRDLSLRKLSSWYTAAMKRFNSSTKSRIISSLHNMYLQSVANYLNATRNMHIATSNLTTTRSRSFGLDVVAQVLFSENDIVLVGELSYFNANMLFQKHKIRIKTIPVDEDGLSVDYILKHYNKGQIRAIYCNPQRHYPTTVTLSAERRLQLLEAANTLECVLIEEEVDFEFQYEGNAMIPLASSDAYGRVIYLGQIGQNYTNTFSTNFVVGPTDFIKELNKYIGLIETTSTDSMKEVVMRDLIEEGELYRQTKKSIQLYRERRDVLVECLYDKFGDDIYIRIPSGGLAIWIEWRIPISLAQFTVCALKHQLTIPSYVLYQNKNICALRIGFASKTVEELKELVGLLYLSYSDLKNIE